MTFSSLTATLAFFFDLMGIALVGWGAGMALAEVIKTEASLFAKKDHFLERSYDRLREDLGHRMVLGLELFLAGDIIRLISAPSFAAILRIGAVLAIRTALAFFLLYEIEKRE